MARKRFSEREVLETLAWQGIIIPCFRCRKPLFFPSKETSELMHYLPFEREHLHEYKLGGEDAPINCRYSCKPCHAIITNGTKATSAGSSKHKIAKVRRLTGQNKPKRKKDWPSRPMEIGKQKWPKRKFQTKSKT